MNEEVHLVRSLYSVRLLNLFDEHICSHVKICYLLGAPSLEVFFPELGNSGIDYPTFHYLPLPR